MAKKHPNDKVVAKARKPQPSADLEQQIKALNVPPAVRDALLALLQRTK